MSSATFELIWFSFSSTNTFDISKSLKPILSPSRRSLLAMFCSRSGVEFMMTASASVSSDYIGANVRFIRHCKKRFCYLND